MAIIRITTTEVQVEDVVYSFSNADQADAFEACAATVDLSHCEREYVPIGKRAAMPLTSAESMPTPARNVG